MQIEIEVSCRVCGSEHLALIRDCKRFSDTTVRSFGDEGLPAYACGRLYVCPSCGIGLRIPCLTDGDLRRLYRAAPAKQMQYEFATNGAWVAARDYLISTFPPEGDVAVVDIGCNEGTFLHGLPVVWKKAGFEPSTASASIAASHGIAVIGSFMDEVSEEQQGMYDVACMFDIFEHLLNPAQTISQALKLLKPGGRLLISTGNMDAWTWKWLKTHHWYLGIPLHLSFARKAFFRWLAAQSNCRIARMSSIPHRIGFVHRIRDVLIGFYFGCRTRAGVWRIPQRLIQSIPGLSWLKHKQTMPPTFYLRDHVFVVLQKSDCTKEMRT